MRSRIVIIFEVVPQKLLERETTNVASDQNMNLKVPKSF